MKFEIGQAFASEIHACVYRKLKLERSGDEVRPGWQMT